MIMVMGVGDVQPWHVYIDWQGLYRGHIEGCNNILFQILFYFQSKSWSRQLLSKKEKVKFHCWSSNTLIELRIGRQSTKWSKLILKVSISLHR